MPIIYGFLQGNLPMDLLASGQSTVPMDNFKSLSYYDHILSVIPNNVLQPFVLVTYYPLC